MKPAMLIDITKCIGCGACTKACKEANDLPMEVDPVRTWKTWKVVEQHDGFFVPTACMHCEDPDCVSVCPVGAMEKTKLGPVIWHGDVCIGCRYCVQSCPFEVPKYQWDSPTPAVGKCIMCYDRLKEGEQPACAQVCPTEATKYGDRNALINEAKQRIKDDPNGYVHYIYGLKEAGGTSILYLSSVPFEKLGFKVKGMDHEFPKLTFKVQKEVPKIFSTAFVFMYGLWWVINRRDELDGKTPEEIKQLEKDIYGLHEDDEEK